MSVDDIDELSINAIRTLTIDAVEKAQSGHAGMPLGAAPMAYVLWTRFLKHNPRNPKWWNRDRFVLSAGHGSMLLYALLHLTGYGLTIEDLKSFRQLDSKTPGHPELGVTPGVEVTTGPLGQGFSMAVGMAIAERSLANKFNKDGLEIVDHHTYVLCGDGDLMEGVSSEAASLAGHQSLNKLIVLYDSNGISQDGSTKTTFTENVGLRFEAYGWNVITVEDGNDLKSINGAIREARSEQSRPTLIEVRTVIGFGSPNKEGTHFIHSGPLGAEECLAAKRNYNWNYPPFVVPDAIYEHFSHLEGIWNKCEQEWRQKFIQYQDLYPNEALLLKRAMSREFKMDMEFAKLSTIRDAAGRDAFSQMIQSFAAQVPIVLTGSADLANSTRSNLDGGDVFSPPDYSGRNIFYGVREHAMGAIMNGMAIHGGVVPYSGTYLVFSDYMRPPIRMAGMMKLPVVYIFTHDSLYVGEDGPTHQPVEQLTALRSIPELFLFRPADSTEVASSIQYAFSREGPSAIVLSRQTLPYLEEVKQNVSNFGRGGYIVFDTEGLPDLIILASGSELHLVLDAARKLSLEGNQIRVVSMPCMELFNSQDKTYQEKVLPSSVGNRLAVEMGNPMPWFRYVGLKGKVIGVESYGQSGKGADVVKRYGFTVDHVLDVSKQLFENRPNI